MIILEHISNSNIQKCTLLKVHDCQKRFICSNAASLNEAGQHPETARPFAIYAGTEMIGFTMFAFDESNDDPADKYWLWRFMIDKSRQNQGYGSSALDAIISYFRQNNADQITLSTSPDNIDAIAFYEKRGFKKNGQLNDTEVILKYFL